MSIWSAALIKYTNKDILLLLTWTVYVAPTFDKQLEENRRQLREILTESREFRRKKVNFANVLKPARSHLHCKP